MRTLILFCLLLVHYMCLRKQVGCPAYCQECSDDPNDLNCYICATGANFVLGSPLACKPAMVNNCYIDNGSGTCLQCVLQFGLSNNVCSPWPIDYKCAYFSSSGSCLLCGVGLNAEAKGLLYVCKGVVNCLDINSYTIDGKCTECGPNFNLIQNTCVEKTNSFDSPCLISGDASINGVCKQCRKDYQLIQFQCIQSSLLKPNCKYHYLNSNLQPLCGLCMPSYTFSQNRECVALTYKELSATDLPSCQIKFSGICFRCTSLTTMNNGLCEFPTRTQIGCSQGCMQCSRDLKICYVCQPNYVHVIGPMLTCANQNVPGCLFEDGNQNCLICLPFFLLNLNQCQSYLTGCISYDLSGVCTGCGGGKTLISGLCIGILNCKVYDAIARTCTTCRDNFVKVQGTCSDESDSCLTFPEGDNQGICKKCNFGYTLNVFDCQPNSVFPKNCLYFNTVTNQCIICFFSYMLDNNKKCVPNDNVVSTGGGIDKCASAYRGICLACNAGFELNKNKCTPRFTDCNAGCSECSFDKAICYVCKPSYVIIPGMSCVSVTVTNCFLEDGYGNCLICNLSFTLKESQCVRDVSGCVLYDQNGNCLLCGGQMVSQGTICVGTINCLSYRSLTDTSKQCVKCSDGFTLDQVTHVCTDTILNHCKTNALATENSGVCPVCATDYQLNGFQCALTTQFPQKCLFFDSSTTPVTCITCIITYEAVTGVCKPKNTVFTTQTTIVNCIVNYKGFCLICTKNNIIVNNRCVYNTHITNCAKTPNCVECSLTGDICFICADGFVHLSEDPYTCVEQKVDNCLFQSSKYQCIACVFPYTLQNDLCKFDLSGCLKYDKGKCVLCGGKTLLKDGKCIGTVNCVSYKYNTNECGKCVNGFRLTALKNCTDQTANHCETTSQDTNRGICTKCAAGYRWNNYMCVDSTKFPSKCLYINPDTLLCDICIFSYRRIMGGYCIPDDTPLTGNGIERCARAFLTVCIQCEKGSALLNGVCGSLTIQNCEVQTNTICDRCRAGFQKTADQFSCERLRPGCLHSTMNINFCTECGIGYALNPRLKQCVLTVLPRNCLTVEFGVCIECKIDFFLNTATYTCDPIPLPKNCVIGRKGICAYCSNGYYAHYPTNICMLLPLSCMYGIVGSCFLCSKGYVMSTVTGTCVSANVPANCLSADISGICSQCMKNFALNPAANTCTAITPIYPAIPYCISVQNGRCYLCITGYYVDDRTGSCLRDVLPDKCVTGYHGQCQLCIKNYQVSGNVCVPLQQISNCAILSDVPGRCDTCNNGFQTTPDGQCQSQTIIPFCTSVNSLNICIRCVTNYIAINGVCLSMRSVCIAMNADGSACITCANGFVKNNGYCYRATATINGKCLSYTFSAMSLTAVCISCAYQWFTYLGGCAPVNYYCTSFDYTNNRCMGCSAGKTPYLYTCV